MPALNSSFVDAVDERGTPGVRRHEHVGLGLAVDVERARRHAQPARAGDPRRRHAGLSRFPPRLRGPRAKGPLRVRSAPTTSSARRCRSPIPAPSARSSRCRASCPVRGPSSASDRSGWPAGFEAADPRALAELGVGKVLTLTSTYDHRIIQGAESGLFLKLRRRVPHRSARLLRRRVRLARAFPTNRRAGRRTSNPLAERGRRRTDPEADPRPRAHQHVPRARAPERPPRPAAHAIRRPARRARPRELRTDDLGPAADLRRRRTGRSPRGDAGRDPGDLARRVLPHDRHRVRPHHGSRAEALDPRARRGRQHLDVARRAASDPRAR